MYVKPAPDRERPGKQLVVRIPNSLALLANEGAEVPENRFWLRRLAQGDVVRADPPKAAPSAPTKENAA